MPRHVGQPQQHRAVWKENVIIPGHCLSRLIQPRHGLPVECGTDWQQVLLDATRLIHLCGPSLFGCDQRPAHVIHRKGELAEFAV